MPRPRLPLATLLLPLLLLGAGPCASLLPLELGLPTPSGELPIAIGLPASADAATATVELDGVDVTHAFAPGGPGLVGQLPLPAPGAHRLVVTRRHEVLPGVSVPVSVGATLESPAPAPVLADPPGAGPHPRSAWLRLRFAAPIPAVARVGWAFGLECTPPGGGEPVAIERSVHVVDDTSLILNPSPALPPGATCRIAWRDPMGAVEDVTFSVAEDAAGAPAVVLYDRSDPLAIAPFPDDYWTEADAGSATGLRIDLPAPPFGEPFQMQAFQALAGQVNGVDGWSRQAPIVVPLSHPLDPSARPIDVAGSTDPLAPVWLVDVDPASPDFATRIPYHMELRSDPRPGGGLDHVALLFPTIDLRAGGRYAVVVTTRAFAAGEPGRPFGPSAPFAAVLGEPESGEPAPIARARARLAPALEAVGALPDLPVPVEDIALALSISVRGHPPVDDLVHIKELALAAPPPVIEFPDVTSDPCPQPGSFCVSLSANRALVARGRVSLPDYRGPLGTFQRDPVTGLPVQTGVSEVPVVLSLPLAALDGPVHPVMYQHGNPGSPTEILNERASGAIDDAGLALIGIQDTLNREIGQDVALQVQVIFFFMIQSQQIPAYWNQTGSDMIWFLRAIQGLGDLDLMHADANGNPAIGPDGIPEIDPSVILYKGISEGANNAQRFLPFAPEILAAEATVGGARLGETLIHQSADEILSQIGAFLPQLKPVELWVGLSLFQAGFDPQDGHSYLRHLYEEPLLPFAGSSDVTPPSTIWTEGIGDSLVPNNATRAMAHALALPHVGPIARAVPTLEQVDPPLASNIAPGITAGYFQFDPATTFSCVLEGQTEGHYCPQTAPEAVAQRLHFLLSALAGNPEIVDPF